VKAAIPIGKVAGIPIRVHVSFLLVVGWIAWLGWDEGGWRASVWAAVLVVMLFGCVVLHELGHSLVAMSFGSRVRSVTLYPVGGVAGLESVPRQPLRELLMALAGPAVNAAIALALSLWRGGFPGWTEASAFPTNASELRDALIRANVVLGIFNLLPAFPMDGGRVLRSLFALAFPYPRATSLAAAIGQALAIGIILLGLAAGNPFLAVIGVFVFLGAGSEEQHVHIQSQLQGLHACDVMNRQILCLTPDDFVSRCRGLEQQTGQHHFAVAHDGRVVGVLSKRVWTQALADHGPNLPVRDAMQRVFFSVDAAAPVDRLYRDLRGLQQDVVPVLDNGRFVGLLSVEDIARHLQPHSGASSATGAGGPPPAWDRFTVDLG
jgi:Zn-dependent protease/predicted transcriptional regulator